MAETQLSFFNDWVRELVDTGYLHNHVRMWFASVWIFTLKIPWQLGAMFMYRHLLDGDPASNTLSWRWVAGLQTKGKFYLAREDNIATYSEGRWQPAEGELAQSACPVLDDEVAQTSPGATQLQCTVPAQSDCGVLTSSEDLSVECDEELASRAQSVALLRFKSLHGESGLVTRFVQEVESDACSRWGARGVAGTEEVVAWAKDKKLSYVVIVAPAVGSDESRMAEAAKGLEQSGVVCSFYRRKWDRELYGLADRGFFPFWERVKKRIEREDPLFRGK
jgi:deoxyribodipyrimidine photo-lyase